MRTKRRFRQCVAEGCEEEVFADIGMCVDCQRESEKRMEKLRLHKGTKPKIPLKELREIFPE